MISIGQSDVERAGGLLSALSAKSSQYVKSVLLKPQCPLHIEQALRRNIVHTNPHLDEYFAELVFRSCLPDMFSSIEFIEESLYSEENDLGAQKLWPQAAVFGIGGTVSYGVVPLLLFDEHVSGRGTLASSCSSLVVQYLEKDFQCGFPESIRKVLREVNTIDGFGGAHPQHIGNIIKTLHNVRFVFSKGSRQKDDVKDFLSFIWKRSLIDACLAAVIYCYENGIDLTSDPDSKKDALWESLKHYVSKTLHTSNPMFERAHQTISSNFGNQKAVFEDAILREGQAPLVDPNGNKIPQNLVLSKVCFACYNCWGSDITDLVMMHFWEALFQSQLNFLSLREELAKAFANKKSAKKRTALGTLRREVLEEVVIDNKIVNRRTGRETHIRSPLWIIGVSPIGEVFNANQPTLNYINRDNNGSGLALIEDIQLGTKALFVGHAVPKDKWAKLVANIQKLEPNSWYDRSEDPSHPAQFILNGNKAHQYVLRSSLDIDALCHLARDAFK